MTQLLLYSQRRPDDLAKELREFREFGRETEVASVAGVPTFRNEFWTSKQRAASNLHEVSYRACFKPQLPRFFLERLTGRGDVVYDPFMGRGTTVLEAALLGRVGWGCDVNPLSRALVAPRLQPPTAGEVAERLRSIDFATHDEPAPAELLVFYHPDTLRELCALRHWLRAREAANALDPVDAWLRMVAVNRLTGHSPGFFSVYTLPPNQAVSVASQRKINARRQQTPPRRDVPALILRKTRSLLDGVTQTQRRDLAAAARGAHLLTANSAATPELADATVALVVTSPPFLNVVQYAQDNWLRCWFCGIDAEAVGIPLQRRVDDWQTAMTAVLAELRRVLRPGGRVAFEVGEVRGGQVNLDEAVLPCARNAGLHPELVMINDQKFTKTANCWGIANNQRGTNTNRIVVLRK